MDEKAGAAVGGHAGLTFRREGVDTRHPGIEMRDCLPECGGELLGLRRRRLHEAPPYDQVLSCWLGCTLTCRSLTEPKPLPAHARRRDTWRCTTGDGGTPRSRMAAR